MGPYRITHLIESHKLRKYEDVSNEKILKLNILFLNMCADIVTGVVINSTLTAIALIITWLIANWYHHKKTKSDIHFDGQKNRALEDLIHRV